jgi:hypothetical protein
MSLKRIFKFVALLTPLIIFVMLLTLPYYSARLSLMRQGLPFARVVPKEKLDIFQYVQTDSFAYQAIVFSDSKAVGIISQPLGSFAQFEWFTDKHNIDDKGFASWFELVPVIVWSLRWWLIPIQIVALLLWLRMREKRVQHSMA